ncbi:MAG: hypothetical protein H7A51_19290 [Akkermansiaceae bacterium]|nr:hypothetical protein [Akkermansiaceae bacterium]
MIGDDAVVPKRKSNAYDGPDFVVTREFFDRYFEKPMPASTFHDLVGKGRIIPWRCMRGRYMLNASLHSMKLPTVKKLPHAETRHSLEDITRLAFTFIDERIFPAPPWLLAVEVVCAEELDLARRIADQHRGKVSMMDPVELKLAYFGGVLDAAVMQANDSVVTEL